MSDATEVSLRDSNGTRGFVEVTSLNSPVSGLFSFLEADTNVTFSAASVEGGNLSSKARLEGRVIAGVFKSVTVTDGGTVLAYNSTSKRNNG